MFVRFVEYGVRDLSDSYFPIPELIFLSDKRREIYVHKRHNVIVKYKYNKKSFTQFYVILTRKPLELIKEILPKLNTALGYECVEARETNAENIFIL